MEMKEIILMKNPNTKLYIIIGLMLTLVVISYFVGRKNVKIEDGYILVTSERLDSLENASKTNVFMMDSLNGELQLMRLELDNAEFLSDVEVEETIKGKYDELHDQNTSDVDAIFIHQYDSAVTARKLAYNGQR